MGEGPLKVARFQEPYMIVSSMCVCDTSLTNKPRQGNYIYLFSFIIYVARGKFIHPMLTYYSFLLHFNIQ